MAADIGMINEIVEEHGARIQNLKRYYPFFVLSQTTLDKFKEAVCELGHGIYHDGIPALFYS